MKINLIIERLCTYFKVNTQTDLAKRLGVSTTTLSNWKSRNTIDYELLFTKCENINFDWLFMGRGRMLSEYDNIYKAPNTLNELPDSYYNLNEVIEAKNETIKTQGKYIANLEKEISKYKKEPAESGQKRKTA